jgi:hypothetical protein
MTHLHIFALNTATDISHTNLTRQKGEAPELPPLADWLGTASLDTDAIELFPVEELGDMALSDYIGLAFAPTAMPREVQTRLDALEGSVLLVPDDALPGPASPGANATLIASLPLTAPDHDATLPKADVTPTPRPLPPTPEHESSPPIALFALIGMAILAAIIVLVGWN